MAFHSNHNSHHTSSCFVLMLCLCLLAAPASARWADDPKYDHNTKIEVTFHSTPEGAALYANEPRTYMGQTPFTLVYQVRKGQCETRQGAEVRWASGAQATISALNLCTSVGKHQQFTFNRPSDAPNLQADLAVALQVQETAMLGALAQAQVDANVLQAYQNAVRPMWSPYVLPKTSYLCLSRPVMRNATYVWCQ